MNVKKIAGEHACGLRVLVWTLAVATCACSSESARNDAAVDPPDAGPADSGPRLGYYRDVKPIIDAKCSACHHTGGVGPVDFSNPRIVASHSQLIRVRVEARNMPPWPPGQQCGRTYQHDRSLSEEQRQTILDWVDLGAELGDPAAEGAPLPRDTGGLSRIDLSLPIPEPYRPNAGDDYHCFVIEWPEAEIRFVTGFNVTPTQPHLVHHVNIFSVDPMSADRLRERDRLDPTPGYACFGGAATETGVALLGAWAPGNLGIEYPAGTGLQLDPGALIILETHYHSPGRVLDSDQMTLDLQLESQVTKRAYIVAFWDYAAWSRNRMMDIPANEPDVMHSFQLDPNGLIHLIAPWITSNELLVYGAGLHMHYLGSRAKLSIIRGDGAEDCMLEIPDWDFHWQSGYLFTEPMEFLVGPDRAYLECHWDNTAENQPYIDGTQRPPADVNWGGTSADEMCIGYAYVAEK